MDTSFEMFKRCSNHLHLTFFLLLCYWLLGVEDSESNLPHGFVADIKAKELLERQPELQYFEAILIDYLTDGSITKAQRGEGQALGMKVWTSVLCFETRPPAGCKAFQVALCSKLHCSMNSRLTCNCRGPSQCTVVGAQYFSPCYVHNWTSHYRYTKVSNACS